MKCPHLEEIGWTCIMAQNVVDLAQPFNNCPYLHKLYINMRRPSTRNYRLNDIANVSVQFCERMRYINIKSLKTKIQMDP